MYRQLLVPVDACEASVELIGNEVGLAHSLGATISSCAARPDQPRMPQTLAKALAAARASGVGCDTVAAGADGQGGGIADAARRVGCDLIVQGARGPERRLGLAAASDALRTLMHAGLPVLVTLGAEPGPASRAIGVLRDEHRSLSAVLQAWGDVLMRSSNHGSMPDLALMRAMLRYLRKLPRARLATATSPSSRGRLRGRTYRKDERTDRRRQREPWQPVGVIDAASA